MKIGVTGPKGRLGSELVRRGCIPLYCDVTDRAWLAETLERAKPDVVIHCAAKTEVDNCEARPMLAAQVNTGGVWNLAQSFAGPIVYLSTDYIFDGKAGPYDEDAPANPISVYGWSKLGGELAVRQRGDVRDLIVRTTVLFDCYSENFVTRIVRRLLADGTLNLPAFLHGSPTYVPHLAAGILAAIEKREGGVLNLVGDRVMSRYEMGQYVADRLELAGHVLPSSVSSTWNANIRPLHAGLKVDKARALDVPIGDPLAGMNEVIKYALETMATR